MSRSNAAGILNVYVTDEDLRGPVQGATVRVAPSQGATSANGDTCRALTDSTGLATFDGASCPSLTGRVTLTAAVAGYAPATWVGVSGSNLTVPIRAASRPEPSTATVSGTIDLWQALPRASANHQLLAIVVASRPARLDDAPEIRQGTRTIVVPGRSTTLQVPANVCLRTTLVDDCRWQLETRAGAQAHFAVIVDQDTNGTADPLDDTSTVMAWAVKTGVAPVAGTVTSGEVLSLIAAGDMEELSAVFPLLPPDMAHLAAFPIFDLGAAGQIAISVPALDFRHPTARVPKPVGILAGMKYDLFAEAQSTDTGGEATTASWVREANPAEVVAAPDWLFPPSGLAAARGIYSFTAAAGATLHRAELQNPATGERLWCVTIFDGSTAFALPDLSPDPLPKGTVKLQVSAFTIPGLDLESFSFDETKDRQTAMATASMAFQR